LFSLSEFLSIYQTIIAFDDRVFEKEYSDSWRNIVLALKGELEKREDSETKINFNPKVHKTIIDELKQIELLMRIG